MIYVRHEVGGSIVIRQLDV